VAALALGAESVQIGTAFLACAGSGASKPAGQLCYRRLKSELTSRTPSPARLARGNRKPLLDELYDIKVLHCPFLYNTPLPKRVAAPASAQERGDLMPLWAGQSVGLCHHTQASELMAELIAKADVFSPDLNHCRPSFLSECKRAPCEKTQSARIRRN
jgi:nitronate monooxygenase